MKRILGGLLFGAVCCMSAAQAGLVVTPTSVSDDFDRTADFRSDATLGGSAWANGADGQWGLIDHKASANSRPASPGICINKALETTSGNKTNFTLSADLLPLHNVHWAGLVWNYQNVSNYYFLQLKAGTNLYQIYRTVNGTTTRLGANGIASGRFETGSVYTVTITSSEAYHFGLEIRKTVDRALLASASIKDDAASFTGGYAGLIQTTPGQDRFRFDNFSLKVEGRSLILSSLFTDHMVLQQRTQVNVWGWSPAGLPVVVTGSWTSVPVQTVADAQGRWTVKIPTPSAGGPYTLTVKSGAEEILLNDVLVGEVWLCSGQSNMEFGLTAAENGQQEAACAQHPGIRLFVVQKNAVRSPVENVKSQWHPCTPESVSSIGSDSYKKGDGRSFSAIGYFFGRVLHKELQVPIGLIQSAYGGTLAEAWMQPEWLVSNGLPSIVESWQNFDVEMVKYNQLMAQWKLDCGTAQQKGVKPPDKPVKPEGRAEQYRPGTLYNGMIAPLTPFAIRGVIWYQGESNTGLIRAYPRRYAAKYSDLFAALISNWRSLWNDADMPFYFVQIAPWSYKNPGGRLAAVLRESQLEVMQKVKNTGMAVVADISDVNDIHPPNKQDVGKRLALWALAKTYGKDVYCSGPAYKGMTRAGSGIRIAFDYTADGLFFKGGAPVGLEIAGADRIFHPATARIEAGTIIVSSEKVPQPEAVRFGFTNAGVPNLFNTAGLPASPFRTDDWTISE